MKISSARDPPCVASSKRRASAPTPPHIMAAACASTAANASDATITRRLMESPQRCIAAWTRSRGWNSGPWALWTMRALRAGALLRRTGPDGGGRLRPGDTRRGFSREILEADARVTGRASDHDLSTPTRAERCTASGGEELRHLVVLDL